MSKRHRPHHHSAPPAATASEGLTAPQTVTIQQPPVIREQSPRQQPPRHSPPELDRIGDILKRVREQRGEALDYISEYLRIRPNYLIALENSKYEELPADAYVIGFLRTYANHLGLDGKAAIDMYRREMAGRRRKPQLAMPQPISQGQAPTVAIVIGVIIAAIVIYALWYMLSTTDRAVTSLQPAMPVATAATPSETAAPATAPDTMVPAAAITATTAPTAAAPTASLDSSATPLAGSSIELPVPAPAATIVSPSPARQPPAPQPTASPSSPAATPAAGTKPAAKPSGKIFGNESNDSRITIGVTRDSWVLITDAAGYTVFDHTLKAGDTYNVPNQAGLRLTTGNAGGLLLTVDGKPLSPLGNSARVLRNMPLDANRLKSGRPLPRAAEPATPASAPEAQPDQTQDQPGASGDSSGD